MKCLYFVLILMAPYAWAFSFDKMACGVTISDTVNERCLTVLNEERLVSGVEGRLTSSQFENQLGKYLQLHQLLKTGEEEILRIPVVVHIIHDGEDTGTGTNISSEQVYSQFDVLNDDFRRAGAGYNENEVGADIQIEFYPATLDPDGNHLSEPGIDRIDGGRYDWRYLLIEDSLKAATIWQPEYYYNIWVLRFGGSYSDVLGYAQFPSLSGLDGLNSDAEVASTDGIVISYTAFGNIGEALFPYDGGRTATHETGHWLGLRHVWGDGDCTVDDYCADTPVAGAANYGCPVGEDSCPDELGLDMIDNYMDYTYDACMDIFTQDQRDRMRTVMSVSPRRVSVINDVPLINDQHYVTVANWTDDTVFVGNVVTFDGDGDTLLFSIITGNESNAWTVDTSGRLLLYPTLFDSDTSVQLTLEVRDHVSYANAVISVDLDFNYIPEVSSQYFTLRVNHTLDSLRFGTIDATDMDGDTLSYKIVAGNEGNGFEVDTVSGDLTVYPSKLSEDGTYELGVRVSDGRATVLDTVTVLVKLNEAPVMEDQSFLLTPGYSGTFLVGAVMASDADADSLFYFLISGDSSVFTLDSLSGNLYMGVAGESEMVYHLKIAVTDGLAGDTAQVSVTEEVLGWHDRENTIVLYPNPAHDELNILSEQPWDEAVLLDFSGQKVRTCIYGSQAVLSLYGLAPGMYFLKIMQAQGTEVHKVIIN